ncbi:uncharacterized protein LOC108477488 [Gossypium arboreum]|uniref:uncharacterized protein LOC108477488 n=1 Tax=Gossypium arboreum TaxID=29729 RepID=UPI000818FFDB|nr:uncharacterized protein LOC108477488 [Gossypium arboreum]
MPPRRVNVRANAQEYAEYWFEGSKRTRKHMSCANKEKLCCAVSLLNGEAQRRWSIVRRGTISNKLTWNYFLEVCKRKFIGEQYMEARKREFLDLVQGDLIVVDYEAEFIQVYLVAQKVVAQNVDMFDELVERAKVVEETLVEPPCSMVTKSGKRTSNGASRQPFKKKCDIQGSDRSIRHEFQPSQSKQQSSVVVSAGGLMGGSGWPLCAHCERRHPGDCCRLTGGFFKSCSKEHILRDCSNRVEV